MQLRSHTHNVSFCAEGFDISTTSNETDIPLEHKKTFLLISIPMQNHARERIYDQNGLDDSGILFPIFIFNITEQAKTMRCHAC